MGPVALDAARFSEEQYLPGQTVRFVVQWRGVANVGHDYNVFVHILNRDGSPVQGAKTDADRTPMNNGVPAPTSSWTAGTIVNDTYDVVLPNNLPAGNYRLEVGLYDDRGRLQVVNYGNSVPQPQGVNSVLIRVIQVQ